MTTNNTQFHLWLRHGRSQLQQHVTHHDESFEWRCQNTNIKAVSLVNDQRMIDAASPIARQLLLLWCTNASPTNAPNIVVHFAATDLSFLQWTKEKCFEKKEKYIGSMESIRNGSREGSFYGRQVEVRYFLHIPLDGLHKSSMNKSWDQSLSLVYISLLLHNKWQLKKQPWQQEWF